MSWTDWAIVALEIWTMAAKPLEVKVFVLAHRDRRFRPVGYHVYLDDGDACFSIGDLYQPDENPNAKADATVLAQCLHHTLTRIRSAKKVEFVIP